MGTLDNLGQYNVNNYGIPLEYFKQNNLDVSYLTNGGTNSTLKNSTTFRDKLFQLHYSAQDLYDGGFSIISLSKAGGLNDTPNGIKYQYDLSELMSIVPKPSIDSIKSTLIDLYPHAGENSEPQLGDFPKLNININTLILLCILFINIALINTNKAKNHDA